MFIKIAARLAGCGVFATALTFLSAAQQTTPPSTPDSSIQTQPQTPAPGQAAPSGAPEPANKLPAGKPSASNDKDQNKNAPDANSSGKNSGTSNDRLFYALPNFLSLENGGKVPPLTAKQKFAVVARGTFDPVQFPWWGFLSGISQAENSEPAYGQGFEGYAKRYGTTAADSIIENFMTQAMLPSLLHQDPRFFQSGKGGFWHRTGYSISRIVITRGDSGKSQFNFSEVFGSALAASISTYSYHPSSTFLSTPTNPHKFIESDRTLGNTASVWATQVSYDTMTIVIKEFWPDVHRALTKKHKTAPGNTTP